MRRAALALFSTVAALVGLLTFKTHNASSRAVPAAIATTDPTASPAPTPSTSTASATAGSSRSTASAGTPATKTVTGDSVDTQYGPVQVRITVRGGKVVSATAVVYPTNDPRDQEINALAIPLLQQESVGVSTANINMVSGATYTSQGYVQSLQSALNKAGL